MSKTWFRNVNLKPLGPYTLEEMRTHVHSGDVGPQDLICDESQGGAWKTAAEWGVFEINLFPAIQSFVPGQEIDENLREWVLLVETSGAPSGVTQEGPYSVLDIKQGLQQGRVSPYQHIWKTGLSGWCQIKDRPEFFSSISSRQLSSERP